jgi:Sec-independent protein secretion pathway component TatC
MVYLVVASENEKPTEVSAVDAAVKKYLPYLQEIQKKLITLLIVILVSGVLGFIYYQKILTFILGIFNLKGITIIMSSPYQFINLAINTGIATGVIIAIPLIIFYLLGFLKPALAPKEFKLIAKLVPLALLLFVVGDAVCHQHLLSNRSRLQRHQYVGHQPLLFPDHHHGCLSRYHL